MWNCPRCSKEYTEATKCDCGYDGAPLEMPAVQTIFSSSPAIDEDRDRKRRNIGLLLALIDILLIAAYLRSAHYVERVSRGLAELLIGSGAAYWIASKMDRGFGLALLVGATTCLVLLILVGFFLVAT